MCLMQIKPISDELKSGIGYKKVFVKIGETNPTSVITLYAREEISFGKEIECQEPLSSNGTYKKLHTSVVDSSLYIPYFHLFTEPIHIHDDEEDRLEPTLYGYYIVKVKCEYNNATVIGTDSNEGKTVIVAKTIKILEIV